MHKKKIKLEDLAKHSGVSVASVSRVINNKLVSAEVESKVLEAISTLKYEKTRRTIKSNQKSSKIIAVFVLDILNPFSPLLIKGIEETLSIQGYNILLCDTRNDDVSQHERMKALIYEHTVEGMIYAPLFEKNLFLEKLIEEDFPIVFVDNVINKKKVSTVTTDNTKGSYQAVKYLITLGHKKIVYLAGDQKFNTEKERYRGYLQALEEEGIPIDNELIISGEYNQQKAYMGIKGLIERGIKFSAIFSANDIMAFGVKQALNEHNIDIPGDVSVIGFDDIDISAAIGLTTFSQPIYEMGRNAAFVLIDLIHKRLKEPKHIVLDPTIVIRNTCRHV